MKRLAIIAGILFVMVIGVTGCYKDVILPKSGTDPNAAPIEYSYKTDIAPLLNTSCALSGCHVAGAQAPDLETAVSYNSLVNGGYVNTLVPKQSDLYIMINGNMEVHIPSAADRQKIYDWIRTGALNN
ncbi:hypothetical protein KXD93_12870 [Mucilaginibacter sp. BJC16-A38]|uniref:hypothetical protein n=1 Tax=Mucilaginibacter phenanthrenivorans TaxID=1234842 RepID=UPI002157C03F|nr:hypothetical protein [Mucilaginibacter phenanthrenivorans]MCR8558541.1 hypothetical protein [Mucilaginibacter phenanthrenivorans]